MTSSNMDDKSTAGLNCFCTLGRFLSEVFYFIYKSVWSETNIHLVSCHVCVLLQLSVTLLFWNFAEFLFIPARAKGARYLTILEGARHGQKDLKMEI